MSKLLNSVKTSNQISLQEIATLLLLWLNNKGSNVKFGKFIHKSFTTCTQNFAKGLDFVDWHVQASLLSHLPYIFTLIYPSYLWHFTTLNETSEEKNNSEEVNLLEYCGYMNTNIFIGPRSPGPIYVSGCHKLREVCETLLMWLRLTKIQTGY